MIKIISSAIIGLAIGATAMYFYNKKKIDELTEINEKYSKEIDDLIAEAHKLRIMKYRDSDISEKAPKDADSEKIREHQPLKTGGEMRTDYTKFYRDGKPDLNDFIKDKDYIDSDDLTVEEEEALDNEIHENKEKVLKIPYFITRDDYEHDHEEYIKRQFEYWSKDSKITDEKLNIINDEDLINNIQISSDTFRGSDIIYIRNDYYSTDIALYKNEDSFEEEMK